MSQALVCQLQAANQEAFCFQNLYSKWEQDHSCKVITSTRGTFMDMFDDDDTLMYEPALTAAVIMTGDDEEAEKAALEVTRHSQQLHRKQTCFWLKLCAARLIAEAVQVY